MSMRDDKQAFVIQQLQECAEAGMTRREAAEALGWRYGMISTLTKRHAIPFRRKPYVHKSEDDDFRAERAASFAERYAAGETLQSIGDSCGITRERVRQILTKMGISGSDGGASIGASTKRVAREDKREAACRARRGCSLAEYESLLRIGREMARRGASRERQPVGAFLSQKGNAKGRGIGWELTLWQWWTIWQESGRWDERGRGHGFVMCRKGDDGPYSVDNVVIAPGHFNASCQKRKTSGLPTGVTCNRGRRFVAKICVNGRIRHLGIFPTAEQAHAAYLTAIAEIASPHREVA